jgi:hypothetical protein
VSARSAQHSLVLADDGIVDLIAVEIAARGTRTVALTRVEQQLAAARILAPRAARLTSYRSGCTSAEPLPSCSRHNARTWRHDQASRRSARGMTSATRPRKGRHCAMAARQALNLCEAELLTLPWDGADMPQAAGSRREQPRISVATARAALRAVGTPPPIAAALSGRLHLFTGREAER